MRLLLARPTDLLPACFGITTALSCLSNAGNIPRKTESQIMWIDSQTFTDIIEAKYIALVDCIDPFLSIAPTTSPAKRTATSSDRNGAYARRSKVSDVRFDSI